MPSGVAAQTPVATPVATAVQTEVPTPEPTTQPTTQPTSAPTPVPEASADAGAAGVTASLPPLPETPAAPEAPPALSSLDDALTAPAVEEKPANPPLPAPEPAGTKDALLQPSEGAGLTEPSRLPQIAPPLSPGDEALPAPGAVPAPVALLAPGALPGPASLPEPMPLPGPVAQPEASALPAPVAEPGPGDAAPAAPGPIAPRVFAPEVKQMPGKPAGPVAVAQDPATSLLKPVAPIGSVPGVATNTLPHVGDAPKEAGAAGAGAADDSPLLRFARRFDGAAGKPLFAILLQDIGAAGMDRTELARLPFPVTFVVDPLAPDAKVAEAVYRAAGQEVLMLANGIPAGATAGDVEQTFQTLQDILPETVGVIDEATLGFQDNRALSGLVLPVIADQGRGLVTYDRGLNAADQIARRDGLPAAVIFRKLDSAGESQPIMRRYLDRAAFKAAQEGAVVVIGDTRPDTVAAILQWTIEGKASSVALAPVTAVMARK